MEPARNPAVVKFIEEGQHLHIDCYWPDCGRRVLLNRQEADKLFQPRFGPNWTLQQIRPVLKCTECGARAKDKRVNAYPSTFDDAIARHRYRLEKEIEMYGSLQTAPMVLPGLGYVYPEDLDLKVTRG